MKKLLILSLALAGLSSCSSDDNDNTQSAQTVAGTLSIKYDNQTYAIANPVITMDGTYLHHNVTMDGNVYFEGTNEVRYAVHIGLEQQSSLSVTACNLTVREEEAIGVYSIKNYHGFVNGEAVAGWSQSGTTSNMQPERRTEAMGEFAGSLVPDGGPVEQQVYISGQYGLVIQ